MSDYRELCERLREEADAVQGIEWEIPICTEDDMLAAAAAIELLANERDAAIADMKINWLCAVCKKRVITKEWMACENKDFYEAPCEAPTCLSFEWRGVQRQENGENDG